MLVYFIRLKTTDAKYDVYLWGTGGTVPPVPVGERVPGEPSPSSLFQALPSDNLRALMTMALSHTDVLMDAGWQPLMQQEEWSWPDIEYDPATASASLSNPPSGP